MSKHTPGPWVITNHGSVDAKDRQIALVSNGGIIDMPNARLIAAAPDLLEVARHCESLFMAYTIDRVDGDEIADATLELIRAAIAKATGE